MCEHIYLLVFSIKIWKIAENSIVWVTEVENEKISLKSGQTVTADRIFLPRTLGMEIDQFHHVFVVSRPLSRS